MNLSTHSLAQGSLLYSIHTDSLIQYSFTSFVSPQGTMFPISHIYTIYFIFTYVDICSKVWGADIGFWGNLKSQTEEKELRAVRGEEKVMEH